MKFSKISLTTASGIPEALTNIIYDHDITVLTDMLEDAKDEDEIYSNLQKLYTKEISSYPQGDRKTDSYYRVTLIDRCNNKSYLKIIY